jgi:hypothetical protein
MMMEEPAFITIPYREFKVIVQEVHSLRDQIAALEARQAADIERLALDMALDRQRITKLEKVEPQPLQKDRADILRALIAANGGKMLAKDARAKLKMDKGNFSRLLDLMKNDIGTKRLSTDRRILLLFIK